MGAVSAHPTLQYALALANQLLRTGDSESADTALASLLDHHADDPRRLHLTGLVHPQRHQEAHVRRTGAGCGPDRRNSPVSRSSAPLRTDHEARRRVGTALDAVRRALAAATSINQLAISRTVWGRQTWRGNAPSTTS